MSPTGELYFIPASYAQERVWVLDRLQPGSSAYHLPARVALRGALDVGALARALSQVARRHESLRTGFTLEDGRTLQVIHPRPAVGLRTFDLCTLGAAERDAVSGRLSAAEAARPFDLTRPPLLRAALLRLEPRSHLLILTLHHIVADGWSVGILIREISAFYAANCAGESSGLPPLPVQYADFALWQRRRLEAGSAREDLEYWTGRLAGAPWGEVLAPDHRHRERRPASPAPAGVCLRMLEPATTAAVKALARRQRTTLFAALLATFKLLLYRHSAQRDLVVGVPVAGRERKEVEGLIGIFLNTLVLRTSLVSVTSFRQLLGVVRQGVTEALTHQALPFERLLDELRGQRGQDGAPRFQVLFNMLNVPQGELVLPGLEVEWLIPPEVGAKFDLTLYVEERPPQLRLRAVYDAGRFQRQRIEELLDQYASLLFQVGADPERPLGAYSLLTARAAEVLGDLSEELDGSWRGGVHEAATRQAGRVPERIAVTDREGAWSYRAVEEITRRLARRLLAAGVGPEQAVAIYGHRSAGLLPAVLGVLQAGAAFTVLDPEHPPLRLAEYLRQSRPVAWVGLTAAGPPAAELEELLSSPGLRCRLSLDGSTGALSGGCGEASSALPAAPAGPAQLACVTFTSGSTGRPKGVGGCHGSLSHFLPWTARRFELGEADRFSALSGLSHDPLQRDLFTPLWLGASLHVPDPERFREPGWLAGWLARERITVAQLSPALGRLITETAPREARLPALRRAFFVGEALRGSDVSRLRGLAPRATFVNLFGTTETQRAGTFHVVGEVEDSARPLPLGRGLPGVRTPILTAAGALAGLGEVGEIHLRSPHLARGYLGAPAATAQRFLPAPAGAAGERLYRTGDLGSYRLDGEVEHRGRADDQVQIRGFRVEPAEAEAMLARHPEVHRAVVTAQRVAGGEPRLIAYVVPGRQPGPGMAELRGYLLRHLPDYMVPVAFVELAELPLLPNHKLDRSALPVVDLEQRAPGRTLTPPRTPVEELLAVLWSEVLGVESVGAEDDFFSLGGHSLAATRLAARLRQAVGADIPLRAIVETPRLRRQAEMVGSYIRRQGPEAPPLRAVPNRSEAPLSFSQERLWFLHRLDPESPVYNLHHALRVGGPLTVEALARSLAAVAARHQVLRLRCEERDGHPVQVFTAAGAVALPAVDLSGLAARDRERLAAKLASVAAVRPFSLERGGLLRVCLLRLAPADHAILFAMHHVISDGWSMGLLIHELAESYAAAAAGRPAALPPLPVQYGDYAHWQRQWLAGALREELLAFWRRHLAGAPPALDLPTDLPRSGPGEPLGAAQVATLPPALVGSLRDLAGRQGATLFMVLASALNAVLWHFTGQEDIVIGSNDANRGRPESENLIGFLVNMVPMRTDLSGDPSLAELLSRVRQATLECHSHQDLPFHLLVQELQIERFPGRPPLVQVNIDFQPAAPRRLEVPGLELKPLGERLLPARFELELVAGFADGALVCTLIYRRDLFFATTARELLKRLELVLERWASDPRIPLSALDRMLAERVEREGLAAKARIRALRQRRRVAGRLRPAAAQAIEGGS
jgi:amino acid adenylation domain-containing protein